MAKADGRRRLKSEVGMPQVEFSGRRIDLAAEARRSRQRLLPASALYTSYALVVLGSALRSPAPVAATLAWFAAGGVSWTLVEYLAHRYILHGRFPDGTGALRHWAHVKLDGLHAEHHARPWDGDHINGTIRDTVLYMTVLAAASFLAPLHTAPVLWAAVMQSYVIEEWVHHGTHFPTVYGLRGPYWRYIVRHHAYHHSPRGTEIAFGLTSGAWDAMLGTRVPVRDRDRLYR
ncbi:MAG: sterol desaturase family protein [Vicinamibacteria bacterium]|nr:sterol desaturase family protein [Vicinamibacteria bacterium]